jgi:hypothetical protein
MQHVVQNRDYIHQVEAIVSKVKVQNARNIFLLHEERISLDHDLKFVQVDEIHQFDWRYIVHNVSQNRNHRDWFEAIIIKEKIENDLNRLLCLTRRRENFVGSRSKVCSGGLYSSY